MMFGVIPEDDMHAKFVHPTYGKEPFNSVQFEFYDSDGKKLNIYEMEEFNSYMSDRSKKNV